MKTAKLVTISLDEETKELLRKLSYSLNVNRSALIREWIIAEASKQGIKHGMD